MKYFLHDTNALDDEKVTELFMNFGYEGVGLFYCILEKIAKQEKPIKTIVLKKQLSVGKKLEKCWSFMESLGLIHSSNDETFNKQLLNFSEKYKIKKEINAKRISDWREKQIVTENVTRNESVRNATKVKESKVKVDNRNVSNSLFSEAVASDGVYKKCIEIYNSFILNKTSVSAKINGKEGVAMNKIINYLKQQVKNKNDLETEIPNALTYIFSHFEKWDNFHKGQLNLSQIESNLINIINSIKNGKSTSKNQPISKYAQ